MTSRGTETARTWSLPAMTGWLWWPFLIVWTACFVFSIVGIVLFARDDVHLTPSTDYALGFVAKSPFATADPDAGATVWIVLSQEAHASGLHANDRVLSMNGRPLERGEQPVPATWRSLGEPGAVTIDTVSPTGMRGTHKLSYRSTHADEGPAQAGFSYRTWRMLRAAALLLIAGVLPLVLALFLLVKRAREPLAPWASLAFILSAITTGPPERSSALRALLSPHVWTAFEASSVVSIALVLTLFPDGKITTRWAWAVLVLGVGFGLQPLIPMTLTWQNLAGALFYLPPVFIIAAKYRGMPPGPGRQQIRWALFGLSLAVLIYFVGIILQAIVFATEKSAVFFLADLSSVLVFETYSLLLFTGVTIGLLRYRLYDADATISRSIIYGALTLGLLGVFAASEKLIEMMGEEYFGERLGALAGALGAATAAILIVPLHHRVTRWAEKRFRSGLVQLRHGLPLLVGDMRETSPPRVLADEALRRVEAGVRAAYGAVIAGDAVLDVRDIDEEAVQTWMADNTGLRDETRTLQVDRGDPVFPVRVPLYADGPGLVGWLLLGARPDGTFYGREEREALAEIADPLARALAIALERERREAARQVREDVLAKDLSELRRLFHKHLGIGKTPGPALS